MSLDALNNLDPDEILKIALKKKAGLDRNWKPLKYKLNKKQIKTKARAKAARKARKNQRRA